MRNELLGYLMGALESDERMRVEVALANDQKLRGEMELLREGLAPLDDGERWEPPPGLVRRTVDFVFLNRVFDVQGPRADEPAVTRMPSDWSDRPAPIRRWRMVDVTVAAGIFVAAAAVVFPAIIQSRANTQRLACQGRMETTYAAVSKYADLHNGALPIATAKNDYTGKAGIYAPLLKEAGYLQNSEDVVCPGSKLADEVNRGDFRLPSLAELNRASGEQLTLYVRRMGGSYAFAIGYRENGQYRMLRLRPGVDFPLMSDSPDEHGKPVGHHGGCGRNVLTVSGVINYIRTCCRPGTHDRLFTNDDGMLDAGVGRHDAVLGRSEIGPLPRE
jgi:hypothetical protein